MSDQRRLRRHPRRPSASLTELIYERPGRTKGIAPTRALLDGVDEVHRRSTVSGRSSPDGESPEQHFLYDAQAGGRERVFGGETPPPELSSPDGAQRLQKLECPDHGWADDAPYVRSTTYGRRHALQARDGQLGRGLSYRGEEEWSSARDAR